jgi:exopolysaccharide biosynthesis polyprenyl glycosylphosphotransferase
VDFVEGTVGAREHLVGEPVWESAQDALAADVSGRHQARVLELPRTRRAWSVPAGRKAALRRGFKRGMDIVLASLALVVFAPVMLAAALLIVLDSPGPALFRQERHGLDGRAFRIFKFRTMSVLEDGDDVVQVREGDTRVTRMGRFLRKSSIDELPQLLNVIRGEMSLVGPRPHAVVHDRVYARLIADYDLRQRVKPGITGWAQVNGLRGETPTVDAMRRRVELDIWYAGHATFALDALILLRTPLEVFRRRNAY